MHYRKGRGVSFADFKISPEGGGGKLLNNTLDCCRLQTRPEKCTVSSVCTVGRVDF